MVRGITVFSRQLPIHGCSLRSSISFRENGPVHHVRGGTGRGRDSGDGDSYYSYKRRRSPRLVTFISLLPASDTSTAILTKVKATGILKQLPIKMPQPSTALPARLRGILEDIFEIPRLDEAPRAASVVTLWATAHQQAAGAPGAQPQPVSAAQPQASAQPAAQPAAAAQPALGAQQQPAGVVPGSWPPPPRRHHPCHGQLRRRPPSHPRYGGTRPHLTALSSQAHNNSERRSPARGAG